MFTVMAIHAEKEYPARLTDPVDAHRGISTDTPLVLVPGENVPTPIVRASDRAPEWCWVLELMLIIPRSSGLFAQPSAVADSKPQLVQLGPEVQATGEIP